MRGFSLFYVIVSHLRFLLLSLLGFAVLMSGVRFYLFSTHHVGPFNTIELLHALWIGFRLDLSLLAYTAALPLLYYFLVWIFNWHKKVLSASVLRVYLFIVFTLISLMLLGDVAYFSYFSQHISIMVFGVIDDDTRALMQIAQKNYNLPLLGTVAFAYFFLLGWLLRRRITFVSFQPPFVLQAAFFALAITLTLLLGRGTLGTFPLAKKLPEVSSDMLINMLPQNGVYATIDAIKQYTKSKRGNYDLIKELGYKGHIRDAFEHYLAAKPSDPLLQNLIKTTPKNAHLEAHPPHVVVVMVESFGLPITAYQSPTFDILGRLKRHFDTDTLFSNIISAGNGTIASMEPFLLNLTARPHSTPFGQSNYLGTAFVQAAARVYHNAGYETRFVYGGDLSWRNVGTFMARQGFEHQDGKGSIKDALHLTGNTIEHDYGVFDQYAYDYLIKQLKEATKPQFIFLLTTNNHPPYTIPANYQGAPLHLSDTLRANITGDLPLATKRLHDYQYALDMAGGFMDAITASTLKDNTVVAITADNNTIEGIMHYDNPINQSKKIPFYLYLPPALHVSDINTSTPGSHKDIFPTLYNLTLSQQSYIALGNNLRDTSVPHCGFNDAGIIISKDGAFQSGAPKTPAQKTCDDYYKATLAVGEYLIQHQNEAPVLTQQDIIRP